MSGICGIINFDRHPVERELLVKMASKASYRGADGIRHYIKEEVGLSHLALYTTPESRIEKQPLINEECGLVLVADARIDDREFLIQKIRAKTSWLSGKPTDAELIMAAYDTWAEDCTKQLLGDFAFVLWDSKIRKLFAARDRGGCRGFYYRWNKNSFMFATEASQLFADNSYQRKLNHHMIARDLVLLPHGGRHMSYFEGIEKLGTGEQISASSNEIRTQQYYQLEPRARIIYEDPREYSEHFRELFEKCVRDRLRCEGEIGLFLSGGIDSASIAALAGAEFAKNSSTITQNLRCINWTYGDNHVSNEQSYARAVARKWDLHLEEFSVLGKAPLYDYPEGQIHSDEPYNSPISSFFNATLEHCSQLPHPPKVWMTGIYGDALIGGQNPFYFLKLFKTGQFVKIFRELSLQKQAYKLNWSQALLFSYLSPMIIRPLRQRIHHMRKGKRIYARDWISQNLIEQTKIYEWIMDLPSVECINNRGSQSQLTDLAQDWRYRALTSNVGERLRTWFERSVAKFGAESWSPWDDSRLADFVVSIPQSQISQGLNHKLILRNSLMDVLPIKIINRRELRTGPGLYMEQGFRKDGRKAVEKITASMRSEELGFINGTIFKDNLENLFLGKTALGKLAWMTLSLEIWLQQQDL